MPERSDRQAIPPSEPGVVGPLQNGISANKKALLLSFFFPFFPASCKAAPPATTTVDPRAKLTQAKPATGANQSLAWAHGESRRHVPFSVFVADGAKRDRLPVWKRGDSRLLLGFKKEEWNRARGEARNSAGLPTTCQRRGADGDVTQVRVIMGPGRWTPKRWDASSSSSATRRRTDDTC